MRHRVSRRLALLSVLALACSPGALDSDARPDPNLVLVISDDHGWPYHGFMGHEFVQTPHLDRLAAEGLTFPYGFNTASECLPSLRTLLSGLHSAQWAARVHALRQNPEHASGPAIRYIETLPRLLGGAGYTSFQGGKYWDGTYTDAGFTHGMTVPRSAEDRKKYNAFEAAAGAAGIELGRRTMQPLWDFLDAHGSRPFFVWFAPMLPHGPHDPAREYLAAYSDTELSPAARRYFANITRFDARLGELLDYLERNDLRDDTLIVYLTDNGYEQHPTNPRHRLPLGGPRGKLSIHEMGFRTPIIWSWPGVIPQGARSDHLVSTVDVFETLLSFAGVAVPPGRMGYDLEPFLMGGGSFDRTRVVSGVVRNRGADEHPADRTGSTGRIAGIHPNNPAYFLRTNDWRYVWQVDPGRETLYRIGEDPFEERDVLAAHPEIASGFRAQVEDWINEAGPSNSPPPGSPRDDETRR